MSNGSREAGSDKNNHLYFGAWHEFLAIITAVATGEIYVVVYAIIFPLVMVGRYLRDRTKRERRNTKSVDRTPNPFGQ